MKAGGIKKSESIDHFARVPNEIIQDKTLSLQAKGLFAYLISLPPSWIVYITELNEHFSNGREAVRTAFKELQDYGLIVSEQIREKNGTLTGWNHIVFDTVQIEAKKPMPKKPISDEPISDSPTVGEPTDGKAVTNKEIPPIKETRKKDTGPSVFSEFLDEQIGTSFSEEIYKWNWQGKDIIKRIVLPIKTSSNESVTILQAAIYYFLNRLDDQGKLKEQPRSEVWSHFVNWVAKKAEFFQDSAWITENQSEFMQHFNAHKVRIKSK